MSKSKSIRNGDSFLDDLINLFFLRPVYRDENPSDKTSEKILIKAERTKKSRNKTTEKQYKESEIKDEVEKTLTSDKSDDKSDDKSTYHDKLLKLWKLRIESIPEVSDTKDYPKTSYKIDDNYFIEIPITSNDLRETIEAIKHIPFKYESLDIDTRSSEFDDFIRRVMDKVSEKDNEDETTQPPLIPRDSISHPDNYRGRSDTD